MIFIFELMHTTAQPQLLNSNDNMNWHKAAKIKKELRTLGAREAWVYLGNNEPTEPFSPSKRVNVLVRVYSPTKRRLDPLNLWPTVKPLEDGMTDAGLWTDDNHNVIEHHDFSYGGLSGTKAFKIEIEIVEL